MQSPSASASPGRGSAPSSGDSGARGFVAGLIPLGSVALIVVIAIVLDALARMLTAGQGFSVQQWAEVIVYVLGVLVSLAALAVLSRRTLHQVAGWREAGLAAQAAGGLWGLAVTALVLMLPVVLGILVPQHPYP